MAQPSWEKEGGSSAVLFPVRQVAGGRWRCKILNYPKLFLNLTEEELEATWQTAPRIDPKWYNVGSRWIPIEHLFVDRARTNLFSKSWSKIERRSYELARIDEFAQVALTNTLRGKDVLHSRNTRVYDLAHSYVRLWNEPFPTEATPYRISAIKFPKPRVELERVSALDQILQDDD